MFAEIDGDTVHYQSYGDGPPVVLVHGLGGTSNMWHGVMQAMAQHHHVVAPDLLGHGRSDAGDELSVGGWAEQVAGLIRHLELPPTTVVGHSVGTLVAQRLALDQPDLCDELVLVGGVAHLDPPQTRGYEERAELVAEEGMEAIVDDWLAGAVSGQTHATMAGGVGLLREMFLRNDPDSYAQACRALANAPKLRRDDIGQRTLILTGAHDGSTPLAMAEELKASIPVSDVQVLPHVAHWSPVEDPGAVAAAVLEFLT